MDSFSILRPFDNVQRLPSDSLTRTPIRSVTQETQQPERVFPYYIVDRVCDVGLSEDGLHKSPLPRMSVPVRICQILAMVYILHFVSADLVQTQPALCCQSATVDGRLLSAKSAGAPRVGAQSHRLRSDL